VADELGTAVLRIVADDSAARESLNVLRRDVEQLTTRATRASRGAGGGRAQGGARENVRALEQAQERRFRLAQRIQRLEDQGAGVSRLRARLGEATTAQSNRQFESQRRISVELSRQVRIAEARLRRERDINAQVARSARAGGPSSPIGGAANIPGSPAAIRAEERLAAARERAAAAAEKASQAEGRRIGRLNVSPVRGGAAFPGSPAFRETTQRALEQTFAQREQRLRSLELSTFRAQEARLKRGETAAKRAGRGFNVSGALSSAVIGGAFPLLFGQGTGAAAGGLFGGLLGAAAGPGGGFAGSLVGTAIGQVADQFNQLAAALDDPIKALDLLKERASLSGRGIEQLAEQLVATGRTAEAGSLIQADLGTTLDPSVIRTVAAANEAYARNVGELQLKLGAFLSGPAVAFSNFLTEIVNRAAGLPTGLPTERGALATRGQGAAAGIGGTLLAGLGLGLSLTGVGASVGLPLALAGGGLAGAGALQIAGAEAQQQQIAASKATEQNQRRIIELDRQRIELQGRINDAGRAGQFNTQRNLQLTDQLAAAEQDRQKAIATFVSTPGAATDREVNAFRAQIEALRLRREELQKNFDIQTKLISADSRIAQLRAGGFQREALVEEGRRVSIAGGDPVAALAQQQTINAQIFALDRERLATSQQQAAQLNIGVGALDRQIASAQRLSSISNVGASSILRENAALIEGVLESISASVDRQREIETRIQAARTRGGDASQQQIQSLTGEQTIAAQQTKKELVSGAGALRDAGRQLAENIRRARDGIRSILEGSFRLLRPEIQQSLLRSARLRVNPAFFDTSKLVGPAEPLARPTI
jgi:hypothetical protein